MGEYQPFYERIRTKSQAKRLGSAIVISYGCECGGVQMVENHTINRCPDCGSYDIKELLRKEVPYTK